MAGEKNPVTFESSQSTLQTLLGLSAVERVDLMRTVDELEKSGADEVRRNPRALGQLAEWMVYAMDGVDHMNANGKVRPPLDDGAIADLQTKRGIYKNLVGAGNDSEAPAEEPSQPKRTSDAKS
jgi:hypothetical protein